MLAVQLARQMYERRKREVASVTIQKEIRANLSRRSYKKMQLSAIHIQAGMRGMSARHDFYVKREHNAAALIQVTTCIQIIGRYGFLIICMPHIFNLPLI